MDTPLNFASFNNLLMEHLDDYLFQIAHQTVCVILWTVTLVICWSELQLLRKFCYCEPGGLLKYDLGRDMPLRLEK